MKTEHFTAIIDLAHRANTALSEVKDCVRIALSCYPDGLRNVEVAKLIGQYASHGTGHRNYLTHAILDELRTAGEVTFDTQSKIYRLVT